MALQFEGATGDKTGAEHGWTLSETSYDPALAAKVESIFALGNGYMGIRAATEERYARETRGFYVAGLFDAFPGEVTELANLPDWLNVELSIDGERFTCVSGRTSSFERRLDLRRGLLVRSLDWESPGGRHVRLRFERFVSLVDLHVGTLRVTVELLDFSGTIRVLSGIDGQVTNSGVQHLGEGQLRLLPDGVVASLSRTQESGIEVCIATTHRYNVDGRAVAPEEHVVIERRRIHLETTLHVERGERLTIAKYACVHTDRDHGRRRDDEPAPGSVGDPFGGGPGDGRRAAPAGSSTALDSPAQDGPQESPLLGRTVTILVNAAAKGFDRLFEVHRSEWEALWRNIDVSVDGPSFDQLALRFALFHLVQMTPRQDPRFSVAAKGLTGEGYKGHVFWDTEIFILPFFSYTMPQVAMHLLDYRFRSLDGARRKARRNGYRGAMYPWESADGGDETTPSFWGVDAVSGRPIPVLSGRLEQHISVEIPYAVWLHRQTTGDDRFLLEAGLEIMLETARFWASRLEWNEERSRYEITDIMGPDEYGEHVSNNAYTNHMAAWLLRTAAAYFDALAARHPRSVAALAEKIAFASWEKSDWLEKAEKLFTNVDATSGFITQYDGFTEKREVDLSKYHGKVGSITADFGWEDLMKMQVVKQADTVMLLYLRGDDFSTEVKRLNWDFYEPRTLHDSSLSPAIHSVVASDMGDEEKAYDYFQRSAKIDLGEDPASSNGGVHAASLGGIWQAAVNGFAGVRVTGEGALRITPRLPKQWNRMSFPLIWHGRRLTVEVTHQRLSIVVQEPSEAFDIECAGVNHTHTGSGTLEIELTRPA